MKMTAFMCLEELHWELGQEYGAELFPTLEDCLRNRRCARNHGVAEVDVTIIAQATKYPIIDNRLWGNVCEAYLLKTDVCGETGLQAQGVLTYPTRQHHDPYRGASFADLVTVEIRYVRTALVPLRKAFVYEEIYYLTGRLLPETAQVH